MTAATETLGDRLRAITDEIVEIPLDYPQRRNWWIFMGAALALLLSFLVSVGVLFTYGVGVWGNNIPVNWSLAIANYIWWIGIGHAGTLISAMLLLVGQDWRNSLNRFAEAMTVFAVICAGIYPVLHLGRPWLFYWMAPYPNTMDIWPQFRSPLTWDFFAVLTYLVVSVLFWYIGAIPDFAAARDRANRRRFQVFYGLIAVGWRGSARHWTRWQQSYKLVAALAVPLVISVHSEVSMLFAAAPIPGWNVTVFPPYFVLGAAFSGFAVVSILAIPLRRAFDLDHIITPRHLDMLGRMLLVTGLLTAYGYVADTFAALYSGEAHELQTLQDRLTGGIAWSYWLAVIANFGPLQLLWWRRVRQSPVLLFAVSAFVVVGMWAERYMLLVSGLYRDYLVSSWGEYAPSLWEWTLFAGTIGLFLTPFLLFVRFLPMVSAFEVSASLYEEERPAEPAPAPPAAEADTTVRRADIGEADPREALFGTMCAFDDPDRLIEAAKAAREGGYRTFDCFTPFPVEGLSAAMGAPRPAVPLLTLVGGILGAVTGFLLQVYTNLDYPLNVGGRPLIATPAFLLVTFELMVLFAVLFALGGMMILNRLPRLHHPVFEVADFRRSASFARFFLLIESADGRWERDGTERFLKGFGPLTIDEVPQTERQR